MNVKISKLIPAGIALSLLIMTANCGGGKDPADLPQTPVTLSSITITPTNPSIAPGTTQQFSARGNYTNGSHIVLTSLATWTSSNSAVANIGNTAGSNGLAMASMAPGETTIAVTYSGVTMTTALTVLPIVSLAVAPFDPPSIAPGTAVLFVLIGTLANSAEQTLTDLATWSSSDTTVATVSDTPGSKGLAIAAFPGTGGTNSATITATYSGASATSMLTSSALSMIALTPALPSIAKGFSQQFTATGTLADMTTQNLTSVSTWSTSNSGVATISNATGSRGLATAVSEGTSTIRSSFNGITSNPATLAVTAAILSTLTVTPNDPSIALGKTRQFTAMGTFSDLTTQDLTSSVAWSSSNTAAATISSAAGSKGLATSVNAGTTSIRATLGGITDSTTLTVTPVALESISVTPLSAIISKGSTTQYAAIGNYSNNTTQDLTAQAIWFSSEIFIASISNATGSQGRAAASNTNSGTTLITATMSGITSNAATLIVQ